MITVYGNGHSAYVRICEFHTNIVEIREDDKYVLQERYCSSKTVWALQIVDL